MLRTSDSNNTFNSDGNIRVFNYSIKILIKVQIMLVGSGKLMAVQQQQITQVQMVFFRFCLSSQ